MVLLLLLFIAAGAGATPVGPALLASALFSLSLVSAAGLGAVELVQVAFVACLAVFGTFFPTLPSSLPPPFLLFRSCVAPIFFLVFIVFVVSALTLPASLLALSVLFFLVFLLLLLYFLHFLQVFLRFHQLDEGEVLH